MAIAEDRWCECEAAGLTRGLRPRIGSFAKRPAVVAALRDDAHLLECIPADIAAEDPSRWCIDREAPRITKADGEHLRPHRAGADGSSVERGDTDERIVRRDAILNDASDVVRVRWMRVWQQAGHSRRHVDIQSKDRGPEIFIDALAVVQAVVLIAFIAQRDVEITVRSKVQVAAVVIAVLIEHRQQIRLGTRQRGIRIVARYLKARDYLMPPRAGLRGGFIGVVKEEEAVRRVARMERHAEHSLLAAGTTDHLRRDVEEHRARRRGEIRDHCHAPGLFHDEQTVDLARRRGDADRVREGQIAERVCQRIRVGRWRGGKSQRSVADAVR